jgi:hypothetical protein
MYRDCDRSKTIWIASVSFVFQSKGRAMTNSCTARPDRYGTMRCVACRVAWDRDDVAACPRQAPPLVVPSETPLYVSALAADYFAPHCK